MSIATAPSPASSATGPRRYVGLVTRVLAFAVDAAIIDVVAIFTATVTVLAFSVVHLSDDLRTVGVVIGSVAYVAWAVGYFVTFWSTTGQTPGNRLLGIRVVMASGASLSPRRAVVRFAALLLAALPLGAGFLLILVDDRRRGLQDVLARTVVVEAGNEGAQDARSRRSPRALT